MFVTVCVIAYNEEKSLNGVLEDILMQDYPHSDMELILVDGASTDKTKSIMQEFAKENKSAKEHLRFREIKVLDNPKKILPAGWNVVLGAYKGEAIVKVDAHASIPKDFVSKNVAALMSGEDVVGGQRPNIIDEPTDWTNTLLLAETSMFGSSIAPYRNNPGKSYVKSLFHGMYRRKVFDKIGGFNERLARTEDNEIHYRIREAGFKIMFSPDIISYQHIRSSLKKMLRQKYANGYWIGLTAWVCPKCLSIYHFVPFAFVLGIIGTTLLGIIGLPQLAGLMWCAYGLLNILMSVMAILKNKFRFTNLLLPIIFLVLHVSYGWGTLVAMFAAPKFRKEYMKEMA